MSKPKKKKYSKSLSLYPLKPEKALALFMQIDPERNKVAKRKAQNFLSQNNCSIRVEEL
jgi:hypothetical protein